MAFLHRISLWSSWQCLEPLEGGRQVGWGGSEEGTTGTRPKSPPCPISKHRQQQMLSSVSHARKQRKALTKMRESAWLPRPLKGKKKIPPHQAHTKTPPAAQKNSNPPEPAAPHPPASSLESEAAAFSTGDAQAAPHQGDWVHQGLRCAWAAISPLACTGEQQRASSHPPAPSLETTHFKALQRD